MTEMKAIFDTAKNFNCRLPNHQSHVSRPRPRVQLFPENHGTYICIGILYCCTLILSTDADAKESNKKNFLAGFATKQVYESHYVANTKYELGLLCMYMCSYSTFGIFPHRTSLKS
jgi:hypothetical protein